MQQLTVRQLADWLSDTDRSKPLLIDVREPWELELCRLDGIHPIPMHLVPTRIGELDAQQETVVICHHGGRSMQVALFLERNGFSKVSNLMGGMDAWAQQIDPTVRRY